MKKKLWLTVCCAVFIAALFLSGQIAAICRGALRTCCETIIPSLFPFFILSVLINRLGLPLYLGRRLSFCGRSLFGVSGAGVTALAMGLTGGYPMGAAYIADMYRQKQITLRESEALLAFCNNSGPAFIIGAVGCGVFGSARTGAILYAVHIMSAVSVGILLKGKRKNFNFPTRTVEPVLERDIPFSLAFSDAVRTAVTSIFNVCGFVVCFTIIVRLLEESTLAVRLMQLCSAYSGLDISCIRVFFSGIFELGCSLGEMGRLSPTPANLSLVSFILGWGGISVHLQTHAVLSGTEIKGALHTAGRLLSGSIASVYTYLLFSFIQMIGQL